MTDIPTITQEEAVEMRARLCALLLDRDGADFDGEVHLTSAEAREVIAALSPNMDHAVGGVREAARAFLINHTASYEGAIMGCRSPSLEEWRAFAAILSAASSTPPVNQDAVREAAEELMHWRLPHDDAFTVTEGSRRAFRKLLAALATPPLDNTGLDAATVERPDGAIENLTNFQQQADMHGEFVKVSRQALDETLAYVAALASGDRS